MPGRPWWLRWPPEEQQRRWAAEGRCPRCGSAEIRRARRGAARATAPAGTSDASGASDDRAAPGTGANRGLVEGGCYEPGTTPNATCLRCGFRFRMIG